MDKDIELNLAYWNKQQDTQSVLTPRIVSGAGFLFVWLIAPPAILIILAAAFLFYSSRKI